jgi:protein ImuB
MSLVAAWALVPGLRALDRDPRAEDEALAGLAAWAGQFTPLVSLVPGQGILLEVGGSLGLFDGLEGLWGQVHRGLLDLGYRGVLAAAPTPLGAWLLARGGGEDRVQDGRTLRDRLARLPLTHTDLPPEHLKSLGGMGILSLGDLMGLPRDGLARRLGAEVVDLLDRALGRLPDPREPYVPPSTFAARLSLPTAVAEVETLLFPLHRLVLELVGYLRAVGGGVERVTVGLEHSRSPATRLTVGLAGPSRDAQHLQALVRERLSRTPLQGPVEAVSLAVGRVVSLDAVSLDLFAGADRTAETWQQLVDRLRVRLGHLAVWELAPVADHRPERAWRPGPAGVDGPREVPGLRPLWLLDPPRVLETSDDRPAWGGVLALQGGPERIEGGWWDGGDISRDYYVAENPAGECAWVFRERQPPHRWFLHGIFS